MYMYQPCCLMPGCQGKLGELRKKQLTKPQKQFILSLCIYILTWDIIQLLFFVLTGPTIKFEVNFLSFKVWGGISVFPSSDLLPLVVISTQVPTFSPGVAQLVSGPQRACFLQDRNGKISTIVSDKVGISSHSCERPPLSPLCPPPSERGRLCRRPSPSPGSWRQRSNPTLWPPLSTNRELSRNHSTLERAQHPKMIDFGIGIQLIWD